MKRSLFLMSLSLLTQVIYAGIYRHDVPVEQYKQLAAQSQFDCVGQILDHKNRLASGSCVLIGDRYVLSAAHCFIESEIKTDTMRLNGNLCTVYTPINERVADVTKYSFRFNRRRYAGKSIKIFPAYRDSATKGECDLVLIELEEAVKGVMPAILNTTFDEMHTVVTGVGYGASGAANTPEDVDMYMEKIAGQNTIDTFQGYELNDRPTLLGCDFDHPTFKTTNQMGSAQPLPLEYMCAGGDSGGGLFRETKQGWVLTGICSGSGTNIGTLLKTGYYGQSMQWTRVSVFNDWIKNTIIEFEKNKTVKKP